MTNPRTNEVACGLCIQARGVPVTHALPECDDADELFNIWLNRVRAGLIDTQEALRGAITEARSQHRVTDTQILEGIAASIEQEARAAGLVGRQTCSSDTHLILMEDDQ